MMGLQALGTMKYLPALDYLAAVMLNRTRPGSIRTTAAVALSKMGATSASPIRQALRDSDERIQQVAIQWAADQKDQDSVPGLLAVLKGSPLPDVRSAALQSLAIISPAATRQLMNTITALLDDPAPEVRIEAISALGNITGSVVSQKVMDIATRDRNPSVRQAALYAFGRWSPVKQRGRVEPILLGALDASEPTPIRQAAAVSLGIIGGPAAEKALITVLDTPTLDPALQRDIVNALGKLRSEAAVPVIAQLLNSESTGVRLAAAIALGRIGDESATKSLLAAMKDKNPLVAQAAQEAFNQMRVPEGSALDTQLADRNPNVRLEAVQKLTPSKYTVPLLIRMLADDSFEVRQAALATLSTVRDPDLLGQVVQAASDRDFRRRQACAVILGRIANPQYAKVLVALYSDTDAGVRAEAVRALGRLDVQTSATVIVKAASDSEPSVRAAAAESLGKLDPSLSKGKLLELAKDPSPEVRAATFIELRKIAVQ